MTLKRRLPLAVLVLMMSLGAACTDEDLVTVSKALNDTAQGVSVLQTAVINAHKTQLLTDDQTRSFLELSIRINEAGLSAVQVTRNINALSTADRASVLKILNPVIDVVREARTQSILGIKNEQTKATIDAALLTISTALNVAQLALATR